MHPFFGDRCRFGRGAWLIVLPCVWLGVGAGQTSPLARISHQLLKNAEPMSSKGALMRASSLSDLDREASEGDGGRSRGS